MLPSSIASITALFTVVVLGHVSQGKTVQEEPPAVRTSGQPEIRRWVKASALNFRRGPGSDHGVIRMLAANEPVRVLERTGQWVRVEWVSEKGALIQGWVFGRFLSETPLAEKKLQGLRMRPRPRAPGAELAALCLVALPVIYLVRRGLRRRALAPRSLRTITPEPRSEARVSGPSFTGPNRRFSSPPMSSFAERPARSLKSGSGAISGKAYVVDGDGIRVSGYEVRLACLDAPEIGQPAKDRDGLLFDHGRRVRSVLIREIAGKRVRVTVEGRDKYGRVLGIVTCNGKDVNAWLVRNGYAVAAYRDRYKNEEREARTGKRGQWAYKEKIEPRTWRDHLARRERRSN